jgi:hypothetical protein
MQAVPTRIVTMANVEHVITTMGSVEQFDDADGTGIQSPTIAASDGAAVGAKSS